MRYPITVEHRCKRCNKQLTVEQSIRQEHGPVCILKVMLVMVESGVKRAKHRPGRLFQARVVWKPFHLRKGGRR